MFDSRLEFDYKDYAEPKQADAKAGVENARKFITALEELIAKK